MFMFKGLVPKAMLLDPGARQKSKKIYTEYGTPPGGSEELYIDESEYLGYTREARFLVRDQAALPGLFELFDGSGILEIEEGGYYKARVINTDHQWVNEVLGYSELTVLFKIQPFFYLDSGIEPSHLMPPAVLDNPAFTTLPIIRVYGSGNINLTINGRVTELRNVVEYIEIDSLLKSVYKGTINAGDQMVGPFPTLDPGANNISAPGAISLTITPRWREL